MDGPDRRPRGILETARDSTYSYPAEMKAGAYIDFDFGDDDYRPKEKRKAKRKVKLTRPPRKRTVLI